MLSVESVISYLHKLRDLALVSNNLKLLELISQSQAAVENRLYCHCASLRNSQISLIIDFVLE